MCILWIPPQMENRSICIFATILWLSVSYRKALWHICVESCVFEVEKCRSICLYNCSPVMCGHVTTYLCISPDITHVSVDLHLPPSVTCIVAYRHIYLCISAWLYRLILMLLHSVSIPVLSNVQNMTNTQRSLAKILFLLQYTLCTIYPQFRKVALKIAVL